MTAGHGHAQRGEEEIGERDCDGLQANSGLLQALYLKE